MALFSQMFGMCLQLLGASPPDPHRGSAPGPPGSKSPSGVQGQSPGGGSSQKLETNANFQLRRADMHPYPIGYATDGDLSLNVCACVTMQGVSTATKQIGVAAM